MRSHQADSPDKGSRIDPSSGSPLVKAAHIRGYMVHGIDVSYHQGKIDWAKVEHPNDELDLDFAFIRASVGEKIDSRFKENWAASKGQIIRGAYHYYWSDLNSAKQARLFIAQVALEAGDLPPVLDIERLPNKQSRSQWLKGLRNYLRMLEEHYGVKPIIYSGDTFYADYLQAHLADYPIWIANYNGVKAPHAAAWNFWQYSDRAVIPGINEYTDINVYRHSMEEFNQLRIKE